MTENRLPAGLPQPDHDEWGYILDSPNLTITYGPGPWPFHKPRAGGPGLPPTGHQPTAVRISPDFACYSWGPEYVILTPQPAGTAHARFRLIPADRTPAHLDPSTYTATFDLRRQLLSYSGDIPHHLDELAEAKTTRIQAFLLNALRERDIGTLRPRTAADLEAARRAVPAGEAAARP